MGKGGGGGGEGLLVEWNDGGSVVKHGQETAVKDFVFNISGRHKTP